MEKKRRNYDQIVKNEKELLRIKDLFKDLRIREKLHEEANKSQDENVEERNKQKYTRNLHNPQNGISASFKNKVIQKEKLK